MLYGFELLLPLAVKVHFVPWQKLQDQESHMILVLHRCNKVAGATKYLKLPTIKNLCLLLLLFYAGLMTCFLNNKNFLCQAFNAVSLPESDKRNVCLD